MKSRVQGASPEHKVMHCDDLVSHIGQFLPLAKCREMRRVSHGWYRMLGRVTVRQSLAGIDVCMRQQKLMAHAQAHLHLHGSGPAHNRFSRLMAATQSNVFELCDEIQAESQRLQHRIRSLQEQFWHACRRHAAAWRRAGFGVSHVHDTMPAARHPACRLQMPLAASLATAATDNGPSLVMLGIMLHEACRRAYPTSMMAESLRSMTSPPRYGVAPLPPQPDLVFIEQLIEKALRDPQPDGMCSIEASGPFSSAESAWREQEFLEFLVLHRLAPEMQQLEASTDLRVARLFEEKRVHSCVATPDGTYKMYRLWRAMPDQIGKAHAETCLREALRRGDWLLIDEVLQRFPRLFWGQHRDQLVAAMLEVAHNPAPASERERMLGIFSRMHDNRAYPLSIHAPARALHTHCLAHQRPAMGEDPIPLLGELDRQAHAITLGIEALWEHPDFEQRVPALLKQVLDRSIQISEPLLLAVICRLDDVNYYDTALRAGLLKIGRFTAPRLIRKPYAWETWLSGTTHLKTILRFDALAILQAYAHRGGVPLRNLCIDQYGQSIPLAVAAKLVDAEKIGYCLSRQGSPFDFRGDEATISFLRALAVDHPELVGKILPMIWLSDPGRQMISLLQERQPWANALVIRHFQSRHGKSHDLSRSFFCSCLRHALAQKLPAGEAEMLFNAIETAMRDAKISLTPVHRDRLIRACRQHAGIEAVPLILGLPYHADFRHGLASLPASARIDLLRLCQGKTAQKTQQRYLRLQGFLKDAGLAAEVYELSGYCLAQLKAGRSTGNTIQPHMLHKPSPYPGSGQQGAGPFRRPWPALASQAGTLTARYDISPIVRELAPLLMQQDAQRTRLRMRLEAVVEEITLRGGLPDRQAASNVLQNALSDAMEEHAQIPPGKLFRALCILDDGALYARVACQQALDVQSLFEFLDPDAPAHLRHPFNMLVTLGARNVFSQILQQRKTLPGKWIEDAIPGIGASLKQGGSNGEFILRQSLPQLSGMSFVRVLQRIIDTCPATLVNRSDPVYLAITGCPAHFSGKQQAERIGMLATRARMAGQPAVEALLRGMTGS